MYSPSSPAFGGPTGGSPASPVYVRVALVLSWVLTNGETAVTQLATSKPKLSFTIRSSV